MLLVQRIHCLISKDNLQITSLSLLAGRICTAWLESGMLLKGISCRGWVVGRTAFYNKYCRQFIGFIFFISNVTHYDSMTGVKL